MAERVFGQMSGFSGFGFPKAHAAAFGLLAYQSTWLRVHYGPEFLCALLNEQPMGFYPPDALVHEAQRRGYRGAARPTSVVSEAECTVEPVGGSVGGRRCGWARLRGGGPRTMRELVAERERGGAIRERRRPGLALGASRAALRRPRRGVERLAWETPRAPRISR